MVNGNSGFECVGFCINIVLTVFMMIYVEWNVSERKRDKDDDDDVDKIDSWMKFMKGCEMCHCECMNE